MKPLLALPLILLVACKGLPSYNTPESVHAVQLTRLSALPTPYRAAAEAGAIYLSQHGEQPSEFYVSLDASDQTDKTIELPLWHVSAFKVSPRVKGNPGGKCRTLYYDVASKQITGTVFWK